MQTQQDQLTCGKLKIRDYRKIELFDVDLAGKHLLLSGPNASGKTTVLEALLSTVGLVPSRQVPEPVRNGSDVAEIEVDLHDRETGELRYRIRQRWEGGKRTYVVHDAAGKPVKPTDFKRLVDPHLCNPVELLNLRPQDQVDEVLRVFGVEPPVARVQEITGEAHPPKERESAAAYLERLSADDTGLYFERRREAGRELKQKQAAIEEHREQSEPAGEEAGGPTMKELLERHKDADARRQIYREQQSAMRDAQAEAKAKAKQLQDRKEQLDRAKADRLAMVKQLADKEAEINDLNARVAKGDSVVAEAERAAAAEMKRLHDVVDPSPELAEIAQQIDTAQARLKAQQAREIAAAEMKRLHDEALKSKAEHESLEHVLEQLRELRRTLLEGRDLGVDGLEIGDGELRLGGVPFRQASQAEAIDAACAVAFRKRPGARIAVIDNGERLDAAHRERVLQLATRHGCQLCLAIVRDGDALEWEVVER